MAETSPVSICMSHEDRARIAMATFPPNSTFKSFLAFNETVRLKTISKKFQSKITVGSKALVIEYIKQSCMSIFFVRFLEESGSWHWSFLPDLNFTKRSQNKRSWVEVSYILKKIQLWVGSALGSLIELIVSSFFLLSQLHLTTTHLFYISSF